MSYLEDVIGNVAHISLEGCILLDLGIATVIPSKIYQINGTQYLCYMIKSLVDHEQYYLSTAMPVCKII